MGLVIKPSGTPNIDKISEYLNTHFVVCYFQYNVICLEQNSNMLIILCLPNWLIMFNLYLQHPHFDKRLWKYLVLNLIIVIPGNYYFLYGIY